MEDGRISGSTRAKFRAALLFALLPALLSISLSGGAAELTGARDRRGTVDRHLKRYSRSNMDPASVARRVRTTGRFSLPTEDGVFDISLVPHDVRSRRYRAEETRAGGSIRTVVPEEIHTYRGVVPGLAGSEARFTIKDESFEGIVITPREWYMVEPMRHYNPGAGRTEMVIYRASDVDPESVGTCATALHEKIGRVQELIAPPPMLQAGGTISVADVATEADYEFVSYHGSAAAANNAILEILNQVDGIYRSQLSLSLSVIYQHAWSTPEDPYSSTSPSTMLGEFRSRWNTEFSSIPFDLAHMWTGKDMDGSTIGIAYVGVACTARSYSYGISQRFSSAPGKYILTAHEIGHNFSASHTEQADPPQADCANTIMNSSVGTGTTFCPFSKSEIGNHATRYPSCLRAEASNCDINGDGRIDVLDMQALTNAVLGAAACPGNCDSNKDGFVNALDVQLQANIILGTASCP